MTADSIERETIVDGPRGARLAILTEAEHIRAWFAFDGADIDLRPGGPLRFRWREHGEFHGVVEAVEPGGVSGSAGRSCQTPSPPRATRPTSSSRSSRPATAPGCASTSAASARSPVDRDKHLSDNTDGWRGALDGLKGHAERVAA